MFRWPGDRETRRVSYFSVAAHRAMALDRRRNDAYAAALREVIGPESVVLDLGAGTGVHGLLAARLGARRVYLVEPEDVILVAEEIVKANGLQSTVRCLKGRIEDCRVPEPVDVIVSALTGNLLVTEDLLQSLFFARDTLLKPGGYLVPNAAFMEAVPVSAPALHAREIASWSDPQQTVDLGPARVYAANTIFYRAEGIRDLPALAEPQRLHMLDFHLDSYGSVDADVTYEIARSGTCHGWVGWFSMKLGGRWLSTSPYEAPLHWSPAFLPLDPPIFFEEGEHVTFSLDRAPFGDWTWKVASSSGEQQHSTLLAEPMNMQTLTKAGAGYRPSLTIEGQVFMHVLSQCDGSRSVDRIAQSLAGAYPNRYRDHTEALAFVRRVVKRHA